MASTVLGKRTRTAADPISVTTRAKRRITLNAPNDENENPFVTCKQAQHGGDPMVLDIASPVKKTRSSKRTVPAKHGRAESRLEISPSKSRLAVTSVEVFEDAKSDRLGTPRTPRHRDVPSKKVPITPRHRVIVGGGKLTPQSIKASRTPSNECTAVYNQARLVFSRSSDPGRLVGRDAERESISAFVQTCIDSKSGGCLYVSGPPGTGKSALVGETIQNLTGSEVLALSTVNCMSVRNTRDLSQKLAEDLELSEQVTFDQLRSVFVDGKTRDSRTYLIILDEVDRLVDLDLSLLYSLFEWSMHPNSRLILIGIANALDLTDRFLPRLKSRNLKPQLLPFMPYSAPQIAEVITSKLKSLAAEGSQTLPFLHPAAVQFCAKKVAAQTGDLRKAFDICRRAVDLAEQEARSRANQDTLLNSPSKTPLTENINLSSPLTPCSPTKQREVYTIETAPKATIAHMARITAQVFSNGATQRLANLNLQQKAVLCALAALEKHTRDSLDSSLPPPRITPSTPSKRPSAPSVKQLFEAYSSLCRRDGLLHPLSSLEFRDVVAGLETLSLLTPADTKARAFGAPVTPSRTPGRRPAMPAIAGDGRRVASAVGGKELAASLEGPGADLLKDILEAGL